MKKNKNIWDLAKLSTQNEHKLSCGTRTFRLIKITYWVVSIYSFMMCLAMMIGNIIWMNEYSIAENVQQQKKFDEQQMQFYTMIFCLVFIVACLVFLHFRLSLLLSIGGCVNCIIVFTLFYNVSLTNDVKNGGMLGFWYKFGVPSALAALLSLFIGLLIFRYKKAVLKTYEGISEKLYKVATDGGSKKISPEEFEKIMDNYNGEELFRNDLPLKKSQRKRKEKLGKNDNSDK